tara:strand:+ start:1112 stop:1297 length:186 start_codon:yes stop_codon:yes gene_type:complete
MQNATEQFKNFEIINGKNFSLISYDVEDQNHWLIITPKGSKLFRSNESFLNAILGNFIEVI